MLSTNPVSFGGKLIIGANNSNLFEGGNKNRHIFEEPFKPESKKLMVDFLYWTKSYNF